MFELEVLMESMAEWRGCCDMVLINMVESLCEADQGLLLQHSFNGWCIIDSQESGRSRWQVLKR